MSLFQNAVLNKYLKGLDAGKVEQAYLTFTEHFHNPDIQENIRNSKEEQYQGEFLIDLFVNVLGYTKNPTPDFNLTTELKNIKGSKKTDGAILSRGLNSLAKALAVIELKGTNTTDLSKVETQAFGYKNNQPGCNYVITSNFEKLRFYIDNAVDFEEFNLFQLSKERFDMLWLCLSSEYLLKDIPKKIKDESLTQEENVTKKLYKDYASFRNEIFDAIQKENPEYDKLTLFKKTQKLLDRFLFIFFAEDRLLLPPNSIRAIVNQWTDLRDKYDEYFPLYDRFKKYFGYMNTGHKGQQHDIFAYNGGLFAPDEILDNIKINDDLLYKHTLNLSNYDFESEVSVNILGHIFEHSLNDIDEIQAEISNNGLQPIEKTTKRKKDGVFYTPKYITKYIVDNTVGKLCEEKKTELHIQETEYEKERKGRQKATLKKLSQKLENYRKWLLQITICDPACGSGAFLNQALDFLIAEHQYIDELQAKLFGDTMVLNEVENAILENNIYGVDINEESVEIAKLSLWLRTAQKGRKLTSLNNNIKCGNSLIDDPTVAGDKAFNWQKEFPGVFKEKNIKAYHITTALHDSRTSQRMIDYKVRKHRDLGTNPLPNYAKLSTKEEIGITEEIIAISQDKQLKIMAYNICGDHIHLLLVCDKEELSTIVKYIKGRTARAHNSNKGINPLVQKENEKSVSLWTQKYGCKEIKDDAQLHNTISYIKTNRTKHELPNNKELQSLVNNPILNQDYEKAFAAEYKGGFDVVIGNPPYVQVNDREFAKFKTQKCSDLYAYFFEKGLELLTINGYLGYITPSSFFTNIGFVSLRNFLFDFSIKSIIDLGENIFTDASVDSGITIISNIKEAESIINVSNETFNYRTIKKSSFQLLEENMFNIYIVPEHLKLANKLETGYVFDDYLNFARGVEFGFNSENVVSKSKIDNYPIVCGGNVLRNRIYFEKKYVNYDSKNLKIYKDRSIYEYEKILVRRIGNKIISSYDDEKYFNVCDVYNIQLKEDFKEIIPLKNIAAILNSRLINFYFQIKFKSVKKLFPKIPIKYLKLLPILEERKLSNKGLLELSNRNIFDNKSIQKAVSQLIELLTTKFNIEKPSKKLQNWHELEFGEFLKELEKARKKEAKNANKGFQPLALQEQAEWLQYFNEQKQKAAKLKTEIDKTDREIDAMVYHLYGLTDEEIAIVEDATK